MTGYSLSHLSNYALDQSLSTLIAKERETTALLLAHIAEFRARRLYVPAGYSSMHAYCVGKLRLSKDAAHKRLQAAGIARRFPTVFQAVAEGRLHLSGLCLLAPYLTEENARELLLSAEGMPTSEIELLIARRFPRSEELPMIESIATSDPTPTSETSHEGPSMESQVPETSSKTAPRQFFDISLRSQVKPIAAQRFSLHLTMSQATRDKLSYAQDLLGHEVAAGDIESVFDRALDVLIAKLEKQKFAATDKPRVPQSTNGRNRRYIPNHVKRAVWKRDGAQCTFISADGHRCSERKGLEFDHIDPVALGGEPTTEGIRLRCRAHNQYAAECVFGKSFMEGKREGAKTLETATEGITGGMTEGATG